jgi:hypothetical protein
MNENGKRLAGYGLLAPTEIEVTEKETFEAHQK